jgi:hypothetical protein
MNDQQTQTAQRGARSAPPLGSARLTKLEAALLAQLAHVRVESTHGLAGQCRCTISGANNALMRLHRRGLIGIEHKGVRGTHGHPTVWYGKEAPNDQAQRRPPGTRSGSGGAQSNSQNRPPAGRGGGSLERTG